MSDLEGLGTAVTGTALGRVVEPETGAVSRGGKGHFHETACLNCDTPLTGNYCAHCGQPAHLHRTLGAFLHDLLHGVLHFEGKTWRTLPMLAFRPGRLTRDYIDGKRARFVSPMGLFLFSVFIMFALVQIAGKSGPGDAAEPGRIDVVSSVAKLQEETENKRDAAVAELEGMAPDAPGRAAAEAALAKAEEDLVTLQSAKKITSVGGADVAVYESGNAWLDDHIIRKWQQNPKLMIYKLQSNGYKFSWLLIPLSLPFVWLLFFWKRGIGLYDHTVFVTYSIAFMSLWFILVSVIALLGGPESLIILLAVTVPVLHLYRHVKGAYELRRFSALWRTAVLLLFVNFTVLLFMASIVLLGSM
ncbi:DUF3667 domain-containing protein [Croceicoccus pelagius]|uniref:DUF3667 domain-containing protein n=1 Tax=Croceicoccus pelagius TaxID=1703341 RepID=A0A916YB37_9SPHN|nr:DUF3667 domain-containing protein [Croceicoccus pelagius]GGD37202.1 hypothetical protein GCM10010989_09190 [Croceicoccus pelagius]